jgi:uncharacterized protein
MTEEKPPLPPFTRETAAQKVQAAEDAWNTRDPERVAQAYTVDSVWRNRDVFVTGRNEIIEFLTQKWDREPDCYRSTGSARRRAGAPDPPRPKWRSS